MRPAVLLLLIAASAEGQMLDTSYLEQHARTRGFMLGRPVRPKVTPDGKAVLFLRSTATSAKMSLYEFDVSTGKARELISPATLLKGAEEKLTPEEKARRERQRVTLGGFTTYHLSPDGAKVLLSLSGRLYVVERAGGKVTELPTGKGTLVDPKWGPKGDGVFYVLDHDVCRIDLKAMKEWPVTKGGTAKKPHGLAEFVAQEEMSRFTGFWPSPDETHLAYQESDHDGVETWFVADPIHPDVEGHPSYYPRPGKKNVAVRLGIVPVGGGATVWVKWDRETYPYLARVDWQEGGLTLLVQNRVQQEQVLLKADPATGTTTTLLVEKDACWLNLNHDKPHWQEDGSFLWDGHTKAGPEVRRWWPDGKSRLVVSAEEGVRSILHDRDGDLYYVASLDPTQAHVHRVGGRPRERLTLSAGPGLHTAEVGKRGAFVVTSSALDGMPKSVVSVSDGLSTGKLVGELPSVAQEPPMKVNQTIAKVGDFWTTIIRPTKFDANLKYPVIVHVYGGPGHQEVLAQMSRRLIDQWIADQGFIVVGIDGRGTPHRGRDFERATYKTFGTMALDDQVTGLKALLAKHPEMDAERVGIYGWSFGGYMAAMAALREPAVFKAAVAGAPVTDWHDYDTHYTERFMGVPGKDDRDYRRESLLTMAKEKTPIAPLLLVHGTADDNVYFRHSLRLADALFREGKEFDVLPLSGLTHLVPDPVVTQRLYGRFVGFFHKHLGKPKAAK